MNRKLCSDKSKFWSTTSQRGKQTMTVNSIFQNARRKDFDLPQGNDRCFRRQACLT